MPDGTPLLSVIICAWTPSPGLNRVLESLQRQRIDRSTFEVIVVDNSAQETVRPMVGELSHAGAIGIWSVHESRLGLSAARNRGIAEARGELVAFLDDDAWADAGWASAIIQAYEELPGTDCVGGQIILQGCEVMPSWWKPPFNEACGELNYGPYRRQVGYPRYPYGGNITFRKSALARAGVFSTQLGPVGHRHLDGEEYELCLRLERQGGKIFFDPAIKVYHVVSPHRLRRRFVWHKAFYHGRAIAMIEAGHFGRRFALWRSVPIRRDLVRRRRVAFASTRLLDGRHPQAGNQHAASTSNLESWLTQRAKQDAAIPIMKTLAQGLGYGYQTFAHELWRFHPAVPPREEPLR